jgi:hypothetical protein
MMLVGRLAYSLVGTGTSDFGTVDAVSKAPMIESEKERIELLWPEYQYRHEHCWKLVFQTTAAATALGITPYLNSSVARGLGQPILIAPLLAVLLSIVAMWSVEHELRVLDKIRSEYRRTQTKALGIEHRTSSTFRLRVILYLAALVTLASGTSLL